jgi:hypothetical protein
VTPRWYPEGRLVSRRKKRHQGAEVPLRSANSARRRPTESQSGDVPRNNLTSEQPDDLIASVVGDLRALRDSDLEHPSEPVLRDVSARLRRLLHDRTLHQLRKANGLKGGPRILAPALPDGGGGVTHQSPVRPRGESVTVYAELAVAAVKRAPSVVCERMAAARSTSRWLHSTTTPARWLQRCGPRRCRGHGRSDPDLSRSVSSAQPRGQR